MKNTLFLILTLISSLLFGQRTKTNTAKLEYTQYPSVPVEGLNTLGIQIYTADLPFTKDTLRLYLGNMDIMKSDVEQISKVQYNTLNTVDIAGGNGDITVSMAFGKPQIVSKKKETTSCVPAKEGCRQHFYNVEYRLPAIVQVKNADGVLDSYALNPNLKLKFGNEQIEKHREIENGTSTSIQVVIFRDETELASAFASKGKADLARKAIVAHMGSMAEYIYETVFFKESKLKLDIAFGSGKMTDYAETETAADLAIRALEANDYTALQPSIEIWEKWLNQFDPNDRKAAVNHKVARGLHENLSIAYTFTNDFDKARKHLNNALTFAQTGIVNTNQVNKLLSFHTFIDQREKSSKHNTSLNPKSFVTAPDIKKILGRRSLNKDLDFLFPVDKYSEFTSNTALQNTSTENTEITVENLLSQVLGGTSAGQADDEVSLEGRVENNMLILSGLVDGNMRGKPLPSTICNYQDIEVIRARNIGLTALPACMQDLTELKKLYVNSNSFTELPNIFEDMHNLEVLDISNNALSALPESIFSLSQLSKIMISGNAFSDETVNKLKEALPNTKFK